MLSSVDSTDITWRQKHSSVLASEDSTDISKHSSVLFSVDNMISFLPVSATSIVEMINADKLRYRQMFWNNEILYPVFLLHFYTFPSDRLSSSSLWCISGHSPLGFIRYGLLWVYHEFPRWISIFCFTRARASSLCCRLGQIYCKMVIISSHLYHCLRQLSYHTLTQSHFILIISNCVTKP